MEPPSKRLKISRTQAQPIYSHEQPRQRRHESGRSNLAHANSLSIRPNMDFSKRFFPRKLKHDAERIASERKPKERRQAVEVETVVVDVAVDVTLDQEGNAIDIVTNPAPLPSVPAVPQFPSDFTVPAVPSLIPVPPVTLPVVPPYPFITVGEQASVSPPAPTDNSTRTNDVTGAAASSLFGSSSPTPDAAPSSSPATSLTISGSSAIETSLSDSISATDVSSFLSVTLSGVSTDSTGGWLDASGIMTNTDVAGGGGTGAPNAPVFTGGSDSEGGKDSDGDSQTTPAVVGGVVGGIAGIALLLGLALVILRWVKLRRRGGALQLDEGDTMETGPLTMQERNSFMPPAAAAFLHRFSGASKETDITSSTQERGFQRISGRKLPSAFSPGMSIEEARDIQNLSQSSFYRDSQGFYGGSGGVAGRPTAGATVVGLSAIEKETMMPSPARTPVVQQSPYGFVPTGGAGDHVSGASTLSPPQSPLPQIRGTLGRSHPSFDGSRGSKFTEDV